jgi:hypothetical protein
VPGNILPGIQIQFDRATNFHDMGSTASDGIFLSKTEVLQLINDIPFDGITVSKSFITDEPESTSDFLREVCIKLLGALVENIPDGSSPLATLEAQSFFRAVTPEATNAGIF